MEGVGQEDEAVRGRSRRHHLGGDPAPHRTAAVNELLAPERGPRVLSDGAGRGLQHRGGIGAALPALRVEEVVEDDASAGAAERVGESNEGGLTPVSSRPVPEDDRGPALPVKRGAHLPARRPDPDLPHGPSIAAGHPAPAQGGTLSRSQRRAPSVYEAWYGLAEKPFNLTPDPKYLYLSRRHAEAFAHLEFGQRERGGFILLTGEVGTGKTTLARYFLGRLPDNTATAVVVYPALTAAELLRSILEDLHVPAESTSLKDLVDCAPRVPAGSARAGTQRHPAHRRGPGPLRGGAGAGPAHLEPRDRHREAHPDRPSRPVGAAASCCRAATCGSSPSA